MFGRKLGEPAAGWLATLIGAAAASFLSVVVWSTFFSLSSGATRHAHRSVIEKIWTWVPVGSLHVDFGLQLDPLSITMALFVTGVGTLIFLYSIGYMHADPAFPKFFMLLNLFLFSMLCLVLADNFLFSFLGWEGVGFCSYQLISRSLVRAGAAARRGQEGLHHQPGGRLRLHGRGVPDLQPLPELARPTPPSSRSSPRGRQAPSPPPPPPGSP